MPVKISELPATASVLGSALLPAVQGGTTSRLTVNALAAWILQEFSGFTAKGAGALAIPVQTKLRQTINVKDFGAVGDGITDDTAAIQAALDAHKFIMLPAGTYLINGSLSLVSGNTLRGAGRGVTTLKQTGSVTSSTGLLYANSGAAGSRLSGIVIEDLTLDGNGAALGGFSEFQHIVSLNGVENVTLRRIEVKAFRGDGIYVGSGIVGGHERHNVNIVIDDVVVDGVDNDNRNGLSVIDVDGLIVVNSRFVRCSKAGMPGSIDMEPDTNLFHVLRNVTIADNFFDQTNGDNGHVAIVLTAAYTTPAENFIIRGNKFGNKFAVTLIGAADTGKSRNVVIVANAGYGTDYPIRVMTGFWRGILIADNTFYGANPVLLGFASTDTIADSLVTGNLIQSSSGDGMSIKSASGLVIAKNIFRGQATYAIGLGGAGTTVANVAIQQNIFQSVGTYAVLNTGGTWAPETNVFTGNNLGGATHTFLAYINDDAGSVVNGASASTFNFGTLPDTFPAGVSMAVINGDTTGPAGTGGNQGTLYTYRPTKTSGYEKWTYQHYYHANNTLKLGSFWVRRRSSTANTWEAWVEQTS